MRVVVVASGSMSEADARWLEAADLVIAADGGAGSLDRRGLRPDLLVGDLDSIEPALVTRLERAGVRVERHPTDKEATDTELALAAARAAGATQIVLLGALGGHRIDHGLANLLLLADPSLDGFEIRVVSGPTTVRLVLGSTSMTLDGADGDLVSLLPIGGDAAGVTTDGLRWPLHGATLPMGASRGISNEIIDAPASVSLDDGILLVVETATQGGSTP